MSSTEVNVKSLSEYSESAIKTIRPINDKLLVALDSGEREYGNIVIPNVDSDQIDVKISKVLAVSDKAKVATSLGKVKAGDRVLHVRNVSKKMEDVDIRTERNEKCAFLPSEHALAIITDTEILPINDCILVEAQPDRKTYRNITLFVSDSLEIVSCKILATGPSVDKDIKVDQYCIHPLRFGVAIDSFEVRKKFGKPLKLIKEKSVTGIGSGDGAEDIEGKANPEKLPSTDRRLAGY